MSSTMTVETFQVSPATPSGDRPHNEVLAWIRDLEDVDIPSNLDGTIRNEVTVFQPAANQTARPTFGPLSAESSEDGQVIVRDVADVLYGLGETYEQAREDYLSALDEHLNFLRSRELILGPKMRRELELLTRLFPDR